LGREDSPLRDRLIFSFGVQRSGTYWLQRIIGAHPEVSEVPSETQLFYRGIDPLYEVFHHGSRGSPIAGEMFVERDELLDATRDFCDRVLSSYLKPGHRYLAERTASHVYSVPNIAAVYPDGRLVHIVRDGRDVVRSLLNMSFAPDDVREATELWRKGIVEARAAAPPEQYREVRYERLLADPEGQIRELYDWLDLPAGEEEVGAALAEARLTRNEDPADPRAAAGKWRDTFTPEDLAEFMSVGGDLLVELGYQAEQAPTRVGQEPVSRRAVRDVLRRVRRGGGDAEPPFDLYAAQRAVDEFLAAMGAQDRSALEPLLSPDFRARVIGREGERRLDGPEALVAWQAEQPRGQRQLRADPHPGLPNYSVVQTIALPGGETEDRALEFTFRDGRLEVLTIYRFPLARD
jgi:hypothetical protein